MILFQLYPHPMGRSFINTYRRFHHYIIEFSKSSVLKKIIEKQLATIYLCRYYAILAPDRQKHSIKEHQRIIIALKKKDPVAAENAARNHLESVKRDFIKMHSDKKEKGMINERDS